MSEEHDYTRPLMTIILDGKRYRARPHRVGLEYETESTAKPGNAIIGTSAKVSHAIVDIFDIQDAGELVALKAFRRTGQWRYDDDGVSPLFEASGEL